MKDWSFNPKVLYHFAINSGKSFASQNLAQFQTRKGMIINMEVGKASKSIKIITFHRAINYGAVLQTYALYQSLKKMAPVGWDVRVYDYRCGHIERIYRLLIFRKNLRHMVRQALHLPFKAVTKYKVLRFVYHHMHFSAGYNKDDIFITGSDQVWNYTCIGFDKTYFLDFISDKPSRNAYAASFGFEQIPKEYKEQYRRLLKDYNQITVRECQGASILKDLLDIDVSVALDPTMLISKDEWRGLMAVRQSRRNYILLYLLTATDTVLRFAQELSDKTGLKIIYITEKMRKNLKNCIHKRCVGPKEWVSLFANASYVITNSFHGTAFSINFNKLFFTELLPPPSQVNSRLVNILEQFGLKDRLIIYGENNKVDERIDYARVNRILDNERNRSKGYLLDIIGDKGVGI